MVPVDMRGVGEDVLLMVRGFGFQGFKVLWFEVLGL